MAESESNTTIDDALSAMVIAAADKAAERVLKHAAAARIEVEKELEKFNSERDSLLHEISLQIALSSAKAEQNLAEHTLEELKRFSNMETQLVKAVAQMAVSVNSMSEIAADVKSLLASRSFMRGTWKTLSIILAAIGFAVSAIIGAFHIKWPH